MKPLSLVFDIALNDLQYENYKEDYVYPMAYLDSLENNKSIASHVTVGHVPDEGYIDIGAALDTDQHQQYLKSSAMEVPSKYGTVVEGWNPSLSVVTADVKVEKEGKSVSHTVTIEEV